MGDALAPMSDEERYKHLDGEVRCLACGNRKLNRGSKNCWQCGGLKLDRSQIQGMGGPNLPDPPLPIVMRKMTEEEWTKTIVPRFDSGTPIVFFCPIDDKDVAGMVIVTPIGGRMLRCPHGDQFGIGSMFTYPMAWR